MKTIARGMLVVSRGNEHGVISSADFSSQIIPLVYNGVMFVEYTGDFIVTTNRGRMGVMNLDGEMEIPAAYDNIRVLNHLPLLYEVSNNNLVGVLGENGQTVVPIIYEGFGGPPDRGQRRQVLIIPNMIDDDYGIVAVSGRNFGFVNLSTGEEVGTFMLTNVYSILADGERRIEVIFLLDGEEVSEPPTLGWYLDNQDILLLVMDAPTRR
ncbi:MAG: WG repeat-containing protein [Oscillospiraceae bacterium]|nr:WG repeat-containing protein [Oscillospiraceae bacterium]